MIYGALKLATVGCCIGIMFSRAGIIVTSEKAHVLVQDDADLINVLGMYPIRCFVSIITQWNGRQCQVEV